MKVLLLGLMLVPSVAAAEPNNGATHSAPTVEQTATDDCAKARKAGKACVLDVGAEDVGGTAPTANGTSISVIIPPPNGSLIRLRRDFVLEILKSAEDM